MKGAVDFKAAGEFIGYGRTAVETFIKEDPQFPRPFRLQEGGKRLFLVTDLEAWLLARARRVSEPTKARQVEEARV